MQASWHPVHSRPREVPPVRCPPSGAGLNTIVNDGSQEIVKDSITVERQKNQIDPFQLSFIVQPGAIGPDQTEWQADEHRPRIPVTNDGDGAENAEAERHPFQLLFKPCQRHQIEHYVPILRFLFPYYFKVVNRSLEPGVRDGCPGRSGNGHVLLKCPGHDAMMAGGISETGECRHD